MRAFHCTADRQRHKRSTTLREGPGRGTGTARKAGTLRARGAKGDERSRRRRPFRRRASGAATLPAGSGPDGAWKDQHTYYLNMIT